MKTVEDDILGPQRMWNAGTIVSPDAPCVGGVWGVHAYRQVDMDEANLGRPHLALCYGQSTLSAGSSGKGREKVSAVVVRNQVRSLTS